MKTRLTKKQETELSNIVDLMLLEGCSDEQVLVAIKRFIETTQSTVGA
jgi:hypothetical protein